MSNMSYCRFENTLNDVQDCLDALENREISSISEKKKARNLLINFLDYCQNEGIIEDYDSEVIESIINECE